MKKVLLSISWIVLCAFSLIYALMAIKEDKSLEYAAFGLLIATAIINVIIILSHMARKNERIVKLLWIAINLTAPIISYASSGGIFTRDAMIYLSILLIVSSFPASMIMSLLLSLFFWAFQLNLNSYLKWTMAFTFPMILVGYWQWFILAPRLIHNIEKWLSSKKRKDSKQVPQ